jgi:hypothetical protein
VQQLHDGNTAYTRLQQEKHALQVRLQQAEEESMTVVAGVTKQLKETKQGQAAELGSSSVLEWRCVARRHLSLCLCLCTPMPLVLHLFAVCLSV